MSSRNNSWIYVLFFCSLSSFALVGCGGGGSNAPSNVTVVEAPTTLTQPIINTPTATYNSANIAWSASIGSNASNDINYSLFRNGNFIISTSELSYTDLNLLPNTTYYYELKAKNSSGSSPISVVYVTTAVSPATLPTVPTTVITVNGRVTGS